MRICIYTSIINIALPLLLQLATLPSMKMAPSARSIFTIFILLHTLQFQSYAEVSSIIVFGDSSVDAGNNNYIPTPVKSNFKPYGRDFDGGKPTGRFSNGRVPTDFLSEYFGLKKTIPAYFDPAYTIQDFATGVCFASAGTGYDNVTSNVFSVIPLWKELDYYREFQTRLRSYLGIEEADEVLGEALYIISIGTNDFMENYFLLPHRSSEFTVEEFQKFLIGIARSFVTQIYELGARKIVLTGLPPMGCLPLERTTNGGDCIEKYNLVAMDFNRKLEGLVEDLNSRLSDLQLVLSSPYAIVYDIIQNPLSYGFEHAAKACCGSGKVEMGYLCEKHVNPLTCLDASKYVFWDAFHPTDKTNSIVANYVFTKFMSVFQ